jgi:tetratricopeptide (TPR) repeat protein
MLVCHSIEGMPLGAIRLCFNVLALLGLLGLGLGLAVSGLQSQPLDWSHLALGRQLVEAGSLPKSESILYGVNLGFDASAWAWSWGAAEALRVFGPVCLRWMDALLVLGAGLGLVAAGFRRGSRPFSTALFVAWALAAARPDLHPGAGLWAWTAFCAALYLLEGDFWPAFFNRWIWLAPLALVTVNLSPAAWALAPLASLWMANEGGEGTAGAPAQPRLSKGIFLAVLLACLCLHPQGLMPLWRSLGHGLSTPLDPRYFVPRQSALLLLAVAGALLLASSWIRGGRSHLGRDAGLLLAFGLAALLERDALPWALATAAWISAARFDALVDGLPPLLRALRWPAKGAALAGLLAFTVAGGPRWEARPAPALPKQSLEFYQQQLLDLRVLCPPVWTGYLAFQAPPGAGFALDQRGLAPPDRQERLGQALDGQGDWSAALDADGVEACWLPLGSPLAVALSTAQAWQPVSFDDAAVLYVRSTPANAELIRVNAPRGLRPGDCTRPVDPTRLVQAEADLEARLNQDPSCGVLYLYQAELWLAKGQEAKARQTLEAGIRADADFAPNYARLADLRAARGDRLPAAALYRNALRRRDDPAWRAALERLTHA